MFIIPVNIRFFQNLRRIIMIEKPTQYLVKNITQLVREKKKLRNLFGLLVLKHLNL